MTSRDTIWVVVNAEDTERSATPKNAQGCRELCDARIEAQADMLYKELCGQAEQLQVGDMVVMHQGGGRPLGGQLLRAAGRVGRGVRVLRAEDADRWPRLWVVTRKWHGRWPATPSGLSGEQIIEYEFGSTPPPEASPFGIRPRPGNKFLPLHPACTRHTRCSAYDEVHAFWRRAAR